MSPDTSRATLVGSFGTGGVNLEHTIRALALSPDGARVAASQGPRIDVWDRATQRTAAVLENPFGRGTMSSVAFTPDGGRVVASLQDESRAAVFDVATRQVVARHDSGGSVDQTAISPDGKRVILVHNKRATLLDVDSGLAVCARSEIVASRYGSFVALSREGAVVAAIDRAGILTLWEAEKGTPRTVRLPERHKPEAIAISPDGRVALTVTHPYPKREVVLWDVATGAKRRELKGPRSTVYAAAFTPDGARAVIVYGQLEVWDVGKGRLLASGETPWDPDPKLAFLPDGTRALTGNREGTLRVWDLEKARPLTPSDECVPVKSLQVSPDGGRLLAIHWGKRCTLWDLARGERSGELSEEKAGAFLPSPPVRVECESTLVDVTSNDVEYSHRLRAVDTRSGQVLWSDDSSPNDSKVLAHSLDGREALTDGPAGLIRWTVESGKADVLDPHIQHRLHALAGDLSTVAWYVPGAIEWRGRGASWRREIPERSNWGLAALGDGLVAFGDEKGVRVFDTAARGADAAAIGISGDLVTALAFRPGARELLVGTMTGRVLRYRVA